MNEASIPSGPGGFRSNPRLMHLACTYSYAKQTERSASVHSFDSFVVSEFLSDGGGIFAGGGDSSASLGVRYTATVGMATPSANLLKHMRCIV